MSSDTYDKYEGRTARTRQYLSDDSATVRRAEEERRERMWRDAAKAKAEPPRTVAKAPEPIRTNIDLSLAQNYIGDPPTGARDIYILLTDYSGSNREIGMAVTKAAGHMHSMLAGLSTAVAIAFQLFSDHTDGPGLFQEANYTTPDDLGAKILQASIAMIKPAYGDDEPEAIECALRRATQYSFGTVPQARRHLILVTDQVAHGMGYTGRDNGCPDQRDWRDSLRAVHETFGSFTMIASGNDTSIFTLQKQLFTPERLKWDMMNLVTAARLTHEERCRLVPNAILFLIARSLGQQTVEGFLMTLYEKWIADPRYGGDSERRARDQIADFVEYLEIDPAQRQKLLRRIFGTTGAE